MTDSPRFSNGELQERTCPKTQDPNRLCDFCGEITALLYCRADSARLCLTCDRQVHSTNQLFTKHTRSLLCDACDSSPSSIFCSTHSSVLCQNCDWESHGLSLSPVHDRRPIEGFNGCPSVTELLANFGFEELGKKENKGLFGSGGDADGGSENYGFSDYLIWDTSSVSLDDLIASNGSDHKFQAMGVPPLPKNRNTVCGQHKDDILCQLREMAILEPNFDDDQQRLQNPEPSSGFQSLVPEQNSQQLHTCTRFESKAELNFIPSYEASAFQWCSDTTIEGDGDKGLPSSSLQSYVDTNYLVPDKDSEIGHFLDHGNNGHESQSQIPAILEAAQTLPKVVAPRELSSQDRDTAITRYKEKKKSRRYDKHIRYESRKVRAESRTRINGRFAKMDR